MIKRIVLGSALIFLSFFYSISYGQSNCKVLDIKIDKSYSGSCKKGLADGQGEASGIDQYKGEFKKGLPDGTGTYIWQTGESYTGEWKKGIREGNGTYTFKVMGRDSVLAGVWKEDKYVGAKKPIPYVVEYRNGISRISCVKVGDRPYIKYKFSLNGDEANAISDILLQGSSGSETNNASFTGYEQISFPFKGKITFSAPNAFRTATLSGELRIIINEPGSWIVTIFY